MSRRRRNFKRSDRVGSTIRSVLAEELMRIDDPEVDFITFTSVEVDPELSRALVFCSTVNLEDHELSVLREEYGPRLRHAIAKKTDLRRAPQLKFLLDPGLVSGTRIDTILASMQDDRAFQSDTDQPDGPAQ